MVNAAASWDGGTILIDVDREDTEMSAVQSQVRAVLLGWHWGLIRHGCAYNVYSMYIYIYIYDYIRII